MKNSWYLCPQLNQIQTIMRKKGRTIFNLQDPKFKRISNEEFFKTLLDDNEVIMGNGSLRIRIPYNVAEESESSSACNEAAIVLSLRPAIPSAIHLYQPKFSPDKDADIPVPNMNTRSFSQTAWYNS